MHASLWKTQRAWCRTNLQTNLTPIIIQRRSPLNRVTRKEVWLSLKRKKLLASGVIRLIESISVRTLEVWQSLIDIVKFVILGSASIVFRLIAELKLANHDTVANIIMESTTHYFTWERSDQNSTTEDSAKKDKNKQIFHQLPVVPRIITVTYSFKLS